VEIKDKASGGLWLLLAAGALIGGCLLLFMSEPQDKQVAARERITEGVITSRVSGGKVGLHIYYRYSVAGRDFKKEVPCEKVLLPCAAGQKVTVYYDPTDPATSGLEEFYARVIEDHKWGIGTTALGIGMVIVLLWLDVRRGQAADVTS
jgi:hypothetical protein